MIKNLGRALFFAVNLRYGKMRPWEKGRFKAVGICFLNEANDMLFQCGLNGSSVTMLQDTISSMNKIEG